MKNWSVDEEFLKKSPQKYRLWKLEQQLSYGLDKDEKIDKKDLLANWETLRDRLDPGRREFIKFILWG
jgi:hypothetical protein